MIDCETELLRQNEDWCAVLNAYRNQAAEQVDSESDGWLPRISGVEGVQPEHLPRIHGKLIALGLLQFELAGRTDGVRYQLSTLGKQALHQFDAHADYVQPADIDRRSRMGG